MVPGTISSMKILYLLPEMKLGGTERHVIRLAAGLRKRGYDARILCLFREGLLADEVRNDGIPFSCLNMSYRWSLGTSIRLWTELKRLRPFDILHTYLFGFDFFAVLPAFLLGIRTILSSRRELAAWKKGRHYAIENLSNRFVRKHRLLPRACLEPPRSVASPAWPLPGGKSVRAGAP